MRLGQWAMGWTYPPDLRDALAGFGLSPAEHTPPLFVRDALSDLYRYELRELRRRLRRGAVVKADYIGHVVALRKKYWPLTLQPAAWEAICTAISPADETGPSLTG